MLYELVCLLFPKYRKLYACVCGVWTWWTKSLGFGMCLVGVMGEEFVMGGPHAKCEQFSSPEVPLLG